MWINSLATREHDVRGSKLALSKQQLEVFAPTKQVLNMAEPLSKGEMPGFNAALTSLAYVDVDDGRERGRSAAPSAIGRAG